MKAVWIMLLLLIPVAFAQNLEAKQATLDVYASNFLIQMNVSISFLHNKNIDIADLNTIETNFEAKLQQTLQTKTQEDFQADYNDMKSIAKQFKDDLKNIIKDNSSELKDLIKEKLKEKDDDLNKKIEKAKESKRSVLSLAYDAKISELEARIDEGNKTGKVSSVDKLLLKNFEKAKAEINETEISIGSTSAKDMASRIISATKDFFVSMKNFIVEKAKKIGET